jgi:N-glycosylase/DNA lyase
MLFALGKYDSFPLDVWMKRVMEEEYGLTSPKEMAAFAAENFGEYGGFAQQYLFYYVREKNSEK